MNFMKSILLSVAVLLTLALAGCGGTFSQTVQVDDRAYLLLIGNPENNIVVIDNGNPIDLAKDTTSFSLDGRQVTKIQISIGKHTIKVTRGGLLKINRIFYVSTGTTFEIEL